VFNTYAAKLTYKVVGTPAATVTFTIETSTFSNSSTCDIAGITGYYCRAEGGELSLRRGGTRCLSSPVAHVDWTECDLRRTYLGFNTHLDGAKAEGANLSFSYMAYVLADGIDLTRANLHGANLRRAQLRSAHLQKAKMDMVVLYKSELMRAELDGADLSGADLKEADLTGADLRGADLTQAGLRGADLTRVRCDDTTVWPDGTRHHGTACPSTK
jgi:uncharacterized protein YjbI with pentapeptide repeats